MKASVPDELAVWLGRKVRMRALGCVFGGVGLLFIGAVVLLVTYGVVYGVGWMIARGFGLETDVLWIVSSVFVVVLFVGNARTDQAYLESISVTSGTFNDEVVTFYLPGIGMVSSMNPLAPDSMHSLVKVITNCLYGGPRLVVSAVRLWRQAACLFMVDRDGCAKVIMCLHTRGERTTYAEIVREEPGLNPVKVFPQMASIPGVLVLRNDPPGLALGAQLKEEVARVLQSMQAANS